MMSLTPLARRSWLVQWKGRAEEPDAVLDGKTMRISVIFELVPNRAFKDEVPGSMLELLQTCAARDPERQKEIAVLAAIMHGVAHFSGLLSERVLVVRPAGSV
jgi:hypothetical protein